MARSDIAAPGDEPFILAFALQSDQKHEEDDSNPRNDSQNGTIVGGRSCKESTVGIILFMFLVGLESES